TRPPARGALPPRPRRGGRPRASRPPPAPAEASPPEPLRWAAARRSSFARSAPTEFEPSARRLRRQVVAAAAREAWGHRRPAAVEAWRPAHAGRPLAASRAAEEYPR